MTDTKGGTILFVDDEPLSQKYFRASVGKYATVKTASSAEDALKILESEADNISVVVSDERMPYESGVSFLSDVRKSWPTTVRILTSAYADIDNLQHAINDAGIFRFVAKPWNLDELCAAMQDALRLERSAAAGVEPILGPTAGGDVEDANLALLAILANSLEAPLKSLEGEARQLACTSNPGAIDSASLSTSYLASWSNQLRHTKIAATANQMLRDLDHCKSLASSIKNLARGLANPSTIRTSSMADTLLEVLEQNAFSGRTSSLPALDLSRDFTYRMPREIMKFILANLLRGGRLPGRSDGRSPARIELFAGAAHNEVRVTFLLDRPAAAALDDNHSWRTVRSALWAFEGELLASADEVLGKTALIVCLPKAA